MTSGSASSAARRASSATATVNRVGGTVAFQACDAKGDSVVARELTAADLLSLPITRAQLGLAVLNSKGNLRQARCYANRAIEAFTLEQLQARQLTPADTKRVQEIATSCRSA